MSYACLQRSAVRVDSLLHDDFTASVDITAWVTVQVYYGIYGPCNSMCFAREGDIAQISDLNSA